MGRGERIRQVTDRNFARGDGLSWSSITEQIFPANLTKSASSSVKPRSVRVPYRLEETPVAVAAAVPAR